MTIYKAFRKTSYPLCYEMHEVCTHGVLHITWDKRVSLLHGKRKVVDAIPRDFRPCDGTCGCNSTLAKRALRKVVSLTLKARSHLTA